jgi:hypothetical protein
VGSATIGQFVTPRQKEAILALQKLSSNSIEFYDVAATYFSRKSRSDKNCGIIFIILGLLGLLGLIFSPPGGLLDFANGLGIGVFLLFGGKLFELGRGQLARINTSRGADQEQREETLRYFCNRLYCSQAIGVFILRQLGDEAQACMPPISSKFPKAKWIEARERILREQVDDQLNELNKK